MKYLLIMVVMALCACGKSDADSGVRAVPIASPADGVQCFAIYNGESVVGGSCVK